MVDETNSEETPADITDLDAASAGGEAVFAPIGDEVACVTWLWRTLYAPDGASAVCRHCRTVRRFHRISRRRAYACDHCGSQIYPAAGTFMHGSGLDVATWFTAAALIMSSEGRIAARTLSDRLGVSYKTALRIKKRVEKASASGSSDATLLEHLRRLAEGSGHDATPAPGRSSRARDNIRAAACHAFAARGPSATRISDIAREAGVSNAIIHYYYKSKDEVLLAALQWANEQTTRQLRELRDETSDHAERLRCALEMTVPSEGVLRDEYLLWIETWARVRLHPELLAECVTMSARWVDFLQEVIQDGTNAGAFRPVAPAAELAQRLVALSDGLSFRAAIGYSEMGVKRASELLKGFAAEQLGVPIEKLGR